MVMNALTEYDATHVIVLKAILVNIARFQLTTAGIRCAKMEDRVRIEIIPTLVCVHKCIKERTAKFLLVNFHFTIQ